MEPDDERFLDMMNQRKDIATEIHPHFILNWKTYTDRQHFWESSAFRPWRLRRALSSSAASARSTLLAALASPRRALASSQRSPLLAALFRRLSALPSSPHPPLLVALSPLAASPPLRLALPSSSRPSLLAALSPPCRQSCLPLPSTPCTFPSSESQRLFAAAGRDGCWWVLRRLGSGRTGSVGVSGGGSACAQGRRGCGTVRRGRCRGRGGSESPVAVPADAGAPDDDGSYGASTSGGGWCCCGASGWLEPERRPRRARDENCC